MTTKDEKIVLSASDLFGMYVSKNADSEMKMQMCNCCQTCQGGKC